MEKFVANKEEEEEEERNKNYDPVYHTNHMSTPSNFLFPYSEVSACGRAPSRLSAASTDEPLMFSGVGFIFLFSDILRVGSRATL